MGIIKSLGSGVLESELSETLDQRETLYSLNKEVNRQNQKKIKSIWHNHRSKTKRDGGYLNAVGSYRKIESAKGSEFNDAWIVDRLFKSSELYLDEIFKYQMGVYGADDASSFYDAFQRARKFAYHAVIKFPEVLKAKSFPATFFHQDIVMMFDNKVGPNRPGLFDADFAAKRVRGTSEIIARTLFGAKGEWKFKPRVLANCLMLAEMHNHTAIGGNKDPFDDHSLYNQSSTAFTLLTFSYIVGKEITESFKNERTQWAGSRSETDWYFFWKALGSAMGVITELLPNTHQEAEALWAEFLIDETKIVSPGMLQQLVDAEKGIKGIHTGYTGAEGNENLFGKTLAEVVALLGSADVAILLKNADIAEYSREMVKATKLPENGLDIFRVKEATKNLLVLFRHGNRRKIWKKKGRNPVHLRDLIYMVNLIHLLDVYQFVYDRVSESDVLDGMAMSLAFQHYWPLRLRK